MARQPAQRVVHGAFRGSGAAAGQRRALAPAAGAKAVCPRAAATDADIPRHARLAQRNIADRVFLAARRLLLNLVFRFHLFDFYFIVNDQRMFDFRHIDGALALEQGAFALGRPFWLGQRRHGLLDDPPVRLRHLGHKNDESQHDQDDCMDDGGNHPPGGGAELVLQRIQEISRRRCRRLFDIVFVVVPIVVLVVASHRSAAASRGFVSGRATFLVRELSNLLCTA